MELIVAACPTHLIFKRHLIAHLLLKATEKNKFGSHRRKYPMVRTNCIHLLFIHGNLIKHSLPQWHPNSFQAGLYLGLCCTPWRGRFCHTLGSGSLKILRFSEQRDPLAAEISFHIFLSLSFYQGSIIEKNLFSCSIQVMNIKDCGS